RCCELIAQQLFLETYDDAILYGVNRDDVERALARNADAASLPDGVVMNAVVSAQDTTARVNDLAFAGQTIRLVFSFEIAINEASVVAVGHEANLLRFRFLSDRQLARACDIAHLRLRHLAQRKQRARELRLRQLPEKVGLVFLQVAPAKETIAIGRFVKLDTRVMSRRNLFAVEARGQPVERSKLQATVTRDTRNRRLAIQVEIGRAHV